MMLLRSVHRVFHRRSMMRGFAPTDSPSMPRPRAAPTPQRSVAGLVAALSATLLIAACGGGPPKARVEEQQQQRDFANRGYVGAVVAPTGPVSVQGLSVRLRNDVYRLSLSASSGDATDTPRPMVLYLPGLGESDSAGHAWRQAWAASGYAVLTVQVLDDDANAWGSELARAAEFHQLGRQHFAESELRRRVARLDTLLLELRRLGQAAERPWRSLDWSRLAVAGFDLGAQTALALAGEPLSDGSVLHLQSITPRATVVISPQVMREPQPADYQAIRGPVLGITGDHDEDLLGLVSQTRWRRAPWEAMPAGRGWLLRVDAVRHTAFSGTEAPATPEKPDAASRRAEGGGGGGGGGGRRRGGGMPGGMTRMAPVPDMPDYRALHEQQLGLVAARQVSVAFLDQQLKSSTAASDWLATQANGWMGRWGRLIPSGSAASAMPPPVRPTTTPLPR